MAVKKLTYENIREGDEFEPLEKGKITKEQLIEYGESAYDGNPIHTDDEFAQSAGYPGVFAQGMLSMAFLGQYLIGLCGIGNLKKFRARFVRLTWPGEVISCKGVVTKKYIEDGQKYIECDVHTENQEGEKKVQGSATFILP